jgi:rhodanese-related sulfurtransferase
LLALFFKVWRRCVATPLSFLGFARVANMIGGIEEWSLRIDPSVPRY